MTHEPFSQRRHARVAVPSLPFKKMKDVVLGPQYELSLAFVGTTASKRINTQNRGKAKPTNVLSFPLSNTSGEIIITPLIARKEAPRFGMSYRVFVAYLFIHGLLHLKGHTHGATMERLEQTLLRRFNLRKNVERAV